MSGLATLTRDVVAGHAGDPVAAADLLLDPRTDLGEIGAYLTAKALRGAKAEDVVALARVMLSAAVPVPYHGVACDMVGTGGDGSDSVNISTLAALLAVATGATVAKAGNRASTSCCGSADLLEVLGIPVNPGPRAIADALNDTGFAFVLTPAVNPAVARLAPLRRSLGMPTLFNLSGPLTNPVATGARIIGVAKEADHEVMAEAAGRLGLYTAWLVRAQDGMDELSSRVPTKVIAVGAGDTRTFTLDPADLEVSAATVQDLAGGGALENARIARDLFAGRATAGLLDTCALNAAALLAAATNSEIAAYLDQVRRAVTDGTVERLLTRLTTSTRKAEADVSG